MAEWPLRMWKQSWITIEMNFSGNDRVAILILPKNQNPDDSFLYLQELIKCTTILSTKTRSALELLENKFNYQ